MYATAKTAEYAASTARSVVGVQNHTKCIYSINTRTRYFGKFGISYDLDMISDTSVRTAGYIFNTGTSPV